jgi:2-polyprenyl-3-methyl-5-hydroxy-6-metoxy-1,4-benzoquinol methylase
MEPPDTPESMLARSRRALSEVVHRQVRGSRDDRVVRGVAALSPPTTSMLDIGASDGRIAARVARELGAEHVQGVDVERQPDPAIEVSTYNGRELPFADETFDLVTIVDVLHHADEPEAVIREALRVLRPVGRVVIKDHLRTSRWSSWVLLAMDNSSNFSVHELANGRYFSTIEWVNLIASAGGHIEEMIAPFPVHDLPWRLIARSEYQVLFRVSREAAPNGSVGSPSAGV